MCGLIRKLNKRDWRVERYFGDREGKKKYEHDSKKVTSCEGWMERNIGKKKGWEREKRGREWKRCGRKKEKMSNVCFKDNERYNVGKKKDGWK